MVGIDSAGIPQMFYNDNIFSDYLEMLQAKTICR
jgi:hypothetical protein